MTCKYIARMCYRTDKCDCTECLVNEINEYRAKIKNLEDEHKKLRQELAERNTRDKNALVEIVVNGVRITVKGEEECLKL